MPVESILSHYWDLASTDEGVRLKAASELMPALSQAQKQHEKQQRKDGDVTSSCCSELDYSFKRLVKGLASSRKGARQGFTTVLTEVLSQFDCLTPETVISLLSETLEVSSNAKSQEERDSYIGHVFGLMALVRANTTVKGSDLVVQGAPWLTQVVTTLRSLSAKKSYMQELCAKTITDIFALVKPGDFENYLLPALKDCLEVGWSGANTDTLLIMLVAQKLFQEQLNNKAIKKAWGKSFIANKDNYKHLARILQDSICVHPRVHHVWDELLHSILQNPGSDVEQFWSTVVDEGLFQSTHDRKFLGFQLVRMALPQINACHVTVIFSGHMMRCFMNNLSSSQSYLHDAAKYLASSLSTAAAKNPDPEVTSVLIQQLLGSHGNMQFDKFTKTKAVHDLLATLKGSGLHGHISWLLKLFGDGQRDISTDTSPSPKDVESTRIAVLNQLFKLFKNKNLLTSEEEDKVKEVAMFLFDISYFQADKKAKKWKVSLSPAVRQVCEQRFTSALRELTSHTQANHKKGERSSEPTDGPVQFPWIYHIVQHAKECLEDGGHKVASPSWSEEAEKSFKKTVKIIEKIHKKNRGGAKNHEDEAFELLFSHVALQLFSEAEHAEDVLKELKACYEKRREKAKVASSDDDEEPHWVEVLTEILLSLLTRQSSLYRHLVDHTFMVIAPHLTSNALAMILEAVDPRKGTGEGDEVLEMADESDDDDDGDHDDDSGDEEGQHMETGDSEGEQDSDSESDEEEDDDESTEEHEEENGVDEEFRADVQAALGPAAVELDEQVSSDDDDEVSDDLDDEAMMRIDEALAAAFKSHLKSKQKTKDKKDAKKMLLHFKLRVLDVIEIFIKKQPSNPLILELVEPLLDVAWTSLNHKDFQPLGERAQAIYKNKLCAPKDLPQDTDTEEVHERIKRLINKALSAPALPVVSLISRGALFMIRVLRGSVVGHKTKKRDHETNISHSSDNLGVMAEARVAQVYREALVDFMEKRSTHIHPVIFTELISRFPSVAWQLAPDLVQYLEKAVNNFRKSQACVMLTQLLSQKVPQYHNHLLKIAASLQEALHSILCQSAAPNTTVKAKHVKEILKLATKFLKEGNSDEAGDVISMPEELGEALRATMESSVASRSVDIKRTCSTLLPLTGCSVENVQPVKKKKKEGKRHSKRPKGVEAKNDSRRKKPKKS